MVQGDRRTRVRKDGTTTPGRRPITEYESVRVGPQRPVGTGSLLLLILVKECRDTPFYIRKYILIRNTSGTSIGGCNRRDTFDRMLRDLIFTDYRSVLLKTDICWVKTGGVSEGKGDLIFHQNGGKYRSKIIGVRYVHRQET